MILQDLIPQFSLGSLVLVTVYGSKESVQINLDSGKIDEKLLTDQYLKFIPYEEVRPKDYNFVLDLIYRNLKNEDIEKIFDMFSGDKFSTCDIKIEDI